MTTITQTFKFLGLSPKAQEVYELMLMKGPSTAAALSKELGMPRSTIYLELEALSNLKLISITGSYKKRKFLIDNPSVLIEILEKKVADINNLSPAIETLVSNLQNKIANSRWDVPNIKFFKGIAGIKKILESTNHARSKEILGIIPAYDIYKVVGEKYLQNLVAERVKRKIRVKNIWPMGKIPKIIQAHKEQLRNVRFSSEHSALPSTFLVFDNKVILITSTEELFSIEITSHDLAQAIRILFNMMWEKSTDDPRADQGVLK